MRLILPLLFGLVGAAVLVGLGVWQLQRLDWKEGVIAEITARIVADPVPLPADPDPAADRYLPVTLRGTVVGAAAPVFGTWRGAGAGDRIVVPVETGDRRVLVDLGVSPYDPAAAGTAPVLPDGPLTVTGNLDWPEDGGDPPEGGRWYGRDVPALSAALGTEPVLVVAREVVPDPGLVPAPVGVEGIPNNHLGYAIQWFGLAMVWLGMTGFLLWRMTRRTA
ncbi:MAG: SURF1 family protein [Pseudomonadota bacterium]